MRRLSTTASLLCCMFLCAGHCAAQLVYFDEAPARGLYNFDPSNGLSTPRCLMGGSERYFAMDRRPSDGAVFGVDLIGSALWTIDINTCATTRIGTLTPAVDRPEGIAFHPITGELYVDSINGELYKVNPSTAATTFVGASGVGIRGHSFSPNGSMFLAFHQGTGDLYSVNPANAVATLIGPSIPSTAPEDSTFTADGQFFGTAFSGEIYRVDPHTGLATLVGSSGAASGLLSLVSVPEPASLCVLSLILPMLCHRRRAQ